MPLTAHLEELRWRIIKSLGAVAGGFVVAYAFSAQLFAFLVRPVAEALGERPLIGTGLAEAFFTKLKVAFVAGVFFATPVILYQTWRFVAPGLYEHEKRTAVPFVLAGTLFFLLGAAFCYEVVFSVGYRFFLAEYETIGVEPALRISEYLSFSSRLLLGFGITFELPVVTFFLARLGVVTHRTLIGFGRYAVVAIFTLAAILTPPDVASQLLMTGPLLVLYLASVGVAYVAARPRPQEDQGAQAERAQR